MARVADRSYRAYRYCIEHCMRQSPCRNKRAMYSLLRLLHHERGDRETVYLSIYFGESPESPMHPFRFNQKKWEELQKMHASKQHRCLGFQSRTPLVRCTHRIRLCCWNILRKCCRDRRRTSFFLPFHIIVTHTPIHIIGSSAFHYSRAR